MLNEKKEYELYLTEGYDGLIRRANLADSLNGIRSVLTLLSRGFIDCLRDAEISDMEIIGRYTTAFLKVWLVGKVAANEQETLVEMEKIPLLCKQVEKADTANLHKYMNKENITIKKKGSKQKDTDSDRLYYLLGKIKGWSLSMFYEDKNSLNAMRFKSIIADALYMGSLKNEVLLVKRGAKNHGLLGNFEYDRMWSVMGIVAAWLQQKPVENKSGVVVTAQLSNYLGKRAYSKDKTEKYDSINALIERAGYTYNGNPLFILEEVTRSCNKLWVDEGWLYDYRVHLAPADTPDEIGYARYDDDSLRSKKNHK